MARVLLGLCAVSCLDVSCLVPPDFSIAPEVNLPVSIDRSLLEESPDVFHVWSGCPDKFVLDISTAIVNPDDDPRLFIVWIVNYQPGLKQRPDDVDTTRFVFDPCTNGKVLSGTIPNTIEVLIYDRSPASLNNADDARIIVDPETTMDRVTWFFAVEDLTCCGAP
ncbi:MAG: hypothetical protein KC635_10450 [Myxococcales bacterium]|nr:hypothetical protein [Myxococcales bacterium]MCB9736155.1 hypothetical protein [Deltaproteobacteria bacterium]